LSDPESGRPTKLQPNVVVATRAEPANAGTFILAPREGAYDELHQIIKDQRESAKDLPYPFFDRYLGWGHNFWWGEDLWEGIKADAKKWNFHAAHSDQGLLYYWVRYHEKQYTAFRGSVVENFVAGDTKSGVTLKESFNSTVIAAYSPNPNANPDCGVKFEYGCETPYSDFIHYTGKTKPCKRKFAVVCDFEFTFPLFLISFFLSLLFVDNVIHYLDSFRGIWLS
jgi:hypothetical protein